MGEVDKVDEKVGDGIGEGDQKEREDGGGYDKTSKRRVGFGI